MYSNNNTYQLITKNLWDFETRNAEHYHSKPFKDSMDLWNRGGFNREWKVGAVVAFLNKKQPETRQEFAKSYLNELRSAEQVVKFVEEFALKAGLTFEVALNWWWIRVIDMSFTGWQEENQIFSMLQTWLEGTENDVRKVSDYEDRVFGVDAIVFNRLTGKPVEGYQTKPASYFSGNFESNIKAREETNPDKFKKFKEATGADVRYIVIDDSLRFGYLIFQNTHKSFKTSNRFGQLDDKRKPRVTGRGWK